MTANRVSPTALLIARSTALLECEPAAAGLIPPAAAAWSRRFIAAVDGPRSRFLRLIRYPAFRAMLRQIERSVLRGIAMHYVRRKAAIETLVRREIATGVERIVVLAAGFDTLAQRLANEFPYVEFIEIDRPPTQFAKHRAIARDAAPNVRYIAVELSQDFEAIARLAARPVARTLVLAEAVLMYLPAAAVESMLATLAPHCRDVRVAFTYMSPRSRPGHGFESGGELADLFLKLRREPMHWSATPEQIAAGLHAHGLWAQSDTDIADTATAARERLDRANPPLRGERLCVTGYGYTEL